MHPLLARQVRRFFGDGSALPPQWQAFADAVSDVYRNADEHRETLERSLVLSTEELHQANAEMRAVFQAIPDLLFRLDCDGTILDLKAGTPDDLLRPARDLIGRKMQDVPDRRVGDAFRAALDRLASDNAMGRIEYALILDGRECFYEARLVPLLARQVIVIVQNVSTRKRAEAKLADAHKRMLEVSRRAGMADVATGVLHNVGNVLNSVNVSADLARKGIKSTHVATLARAAAMFREHAATNRLFDAAAAAANAAAPDDEKWKAFPSLLVKLAEALAAEQEALARELGSLVANVNHIREIVSMQQSLAGLGGVVGAVTLGELIEDAVKINEAALQRHEVTVVRDFDPALTLSTDRHKLLQILINLISNAKSAVNVPGCASKQVTIRARRVGGSGGGGDGGGALAIAVIDAGVGIEPANLGRIFTFGFTTKKHGHGFGLHASALAARDLGGTLEVHSDGPGRGATFTLTVPVSAGEVARA